jgi:hypothetical protein
MDLVTAVDAVTTLIDTFSSLRNEEELKKFVDAAKLKGSDFGIEDLFKNLGSKHRRSLPHCLKNGQTLLDAAFSHHIDVAPESNTSDAQSKFRTEFYYPLLDLLLSELRRRFSTESCEVLVQLSAFNPTHWNEENIENVRKLAKRYSIPEEATCREYTLLKGSRYLRDLIEEMEKKRMEESLLTFNFKDIWQK